MSALQIQDSCVTILVAKPSLRVRTKKKVSYIVYVATWCVSVHNNKTLPSLSWCVDANRSGSGQSDVPLRFTHSSSNYITAWCLRWHHWFIPGHDCHEDVGAITRFSVALPYPNPWNINCKLKIVMNFSRIWFNTTTSLLLPRHQFEKIIHYPAQIQSLQCGCVISDSKTNNMKVRTMAVEQ